MNTELVVKLMQQDVWQAIIAFLPVGIVTVTIGMLVTVLQSWLHLNDVSLSFVPKLIGVGAVLFFGWWTFSIGFVHWMDHLALSVPMWLQH
ncbi:MAG: flagellar biosynthetic protein FliQ [Acidithiobacillus sp.]|nr:flagellar biosynthetic protein FliQ [Acidithiobacillus sp.]